MKSRTTKILMIVFLFVSMLAINGCETKQKLDQKVKEIGYNYEIIEIDGCEYIQDVMNSDAGLIHKGNCKNPIHQIDKITLPETDIRHYKLPELKQYNKEK